MSYYINRVIEDEEQYVNFNDIIDLLYNVAMEYHTNGFDEAAGALQWVADQLRFSEMVSEFTHEQE